MSAEKTYPTAQQAIEAAKELTASIIRETGAKLSSEEVATKTIDFTPFPYIARIDHGAWTGQRVQVGFTIDNNRNRRYFVENTGKYSTQGY